MKADARQREHRKRIKKNGMVDIRLEIPSTMRDEVRNRARTNNRTMKAEIAAAIEQHLAN